MTISHLRSVYNNKPLLSRYYFLKLRSLPSETICCGLAGVKFQRNKYPISMARELGKLGTISRSTVSVHVEAADRLPQVFLLFLAHCLAGYMVVMRYPSNERIHKPRKIKNHGGKANESDEYYLTNTPEATTTFPGHALLWKKFGAHFELVSELSTGSIRLERF